MGSAWGSAPQDPHLGPAPSEAVHQRPRLGCAARCWHLVAPGPWAAGPAGLDAVGLVGFQDCVRGAGVARP